MPADSQPAWRRTPAIIGGLAVLAAALLVIPGVVLAPPRETSPSQSALVSFPPTDYRSVAWQVAPVGAGSDGAVLSQLLVGDDRLIAIGAEGDAPGAWWSDDGGASWTRGSMEAGTSPPAEGAVAVPRAAAASGGLLVASGLWLEPATSSILGPVVWTSQDGIAWEFHDLADAMPAGATLDRIVGTAGGFYAIGHASDVEPLGWWSSPDGLAWSAISATGLPPLAMLPPAVAWSEEVVLAGNGHGGGHLSRPGIWAAPNWSLGFEEVYDDEAEFGWVAALAGAEYGFVAAGQTVEEADDPSASHIAAWISANGRSWQSLSFESPVGSGAAALAANDAGAVIISWPQPGAASDAWFLPGGASDPVVARIPFAVQGIVAIDDRFVAFGGCEVNEGCTGPMIAIGTPTEEPDASDPTLPAR